MKKLPYWLTPFYCLFWLTSEAQLAGTKWKGTVKTSEEHQVIWVFDKDTTRVIFPDRSEDTEVMLYKEDKDKKQISITKISGTSPCTSNDVGIYSYSITPEGLKIAVVQDPCTERSNAILSVPFTRLTP